MKNFIAIIFLVKFCVGQVDDPGAPLLLTPLIETQQLSEALQLAKVNHADFQDVESYSGLITVNKQFNSNMYFWFFPAEENYPSAPVLVWLQGGPGSSSLFGLFVEHGPFRLNKTTLNVEKREYTWNKKYSVLYIDNPVGSGFSYSDVEGYCTDQTCVGENLYKFLQQFFTLFSDLRSNELYIAGESYGGKYVPAIAHTIHKNNPKAELKLNLKGVAIGNGFSDPINQLNYDEILYQLGYIDEKTKAKMRSSQTKTKTQIRLKLWSLAAKSFLETLYSTSSLFSNASGYNYFYNLQYTEDYQAEDIQNLLKYVEKLQIKKALHVGNTPFNWLNPEVQFKFINELLQSTTPWLSELINNNYKVMLYCGHFDLFLGNPQISNMIDKMSFKGKHDYIAAKKLKWYVNDNLAGYVRGARNFKYVVVRNAGHILPYDVPEVAWELISKFIDDGSLDLRD